MRAIGITLLSIRSLSTGVWVIAALFVLSGLMLLARDQEESRELEMWVFSPEHRAMYVPMIQEYERTSEVNLDLSLLSIAAIRSRMMSGFFGGLPTADLIEVERAAVGQAFMGPTEAIGFRDLTDRLREEGLLEQFNPPSLSPWSVDGRVFGLPHDVHPVMLAYRADITEAAGIDVTRAQTWAEYFELLRPLMEDEDGDGRPDHYPMAFWYTQPDMVETLLLQGGGELFDPEGLPTIDSDRNAWVLAEMISWSVGPERVVTDIDEFSAAGHQARIDAVAIGYMAPDWMCSIWKMHVPQIAGKMKLMPLPAFEPGGLRTSVRGGTMLGFPKESDQFEKAWEYAKLLYTSPEIARDLYRQVDIISPVRSLWDDPVYDEPDPFFMGQRKGRMYIDLAPEIPARTSSPYNLTAVLELRDAAVNLARWGQDQGVYSADGLRPRAKELLAATQRSIVRQMARNAFSGVSEVE
ncbi:MAG: extracellular solute-binding protein [Phycisphaerales bacterium]